MIVEKYRGGTGKMRVEVLYFDGCPTYKTAEKTLQNVLAEESMDAEVELVAVNTDEEARRLRFPGSPTIRLDGRDLFPVEEREEWLLGCRVYATQEGKHRGRWASMTEENKAIARRVYEIISTGNFGRASEIVDQDAPDNELRPGDPPAKLIETFAEAREGFREGLSVVVEDVMGNSPRCVPRIVTRAVTQFPSEGIAATGKRV